MKLQPYVNMLKATKEMAQKTLAPIRANQARKKAELKIAEMDETMAKAEQTIQELCSEHPLDFDKLIDAQEELMLIEARKKHLEQIIVELFDAKSEDAEVK